VWSWSWGRRQAVFAGWSIYRYAADGAKGDCDTAGRNLTVTLLQYYTELNRYAAPLI
jgi:hypothetical protein